MDGVLGVLILNQIDIATFFHQMGDTHLPSDGQKLQVLVFEQGSPQPV